MMRRRNEPGSAPRRAVPLLLSLALGAGALAVDPKGRRPADGEGPPRAAPREIHGGSSAGEIEAAVREIRERMARSAALLGRYELGEPLRREQEETVHLLEELLEKIEAVQKEASSSSSASRSCASGASDRSEKDQERAKERDASKGSQERRTGDGPRDGRERTENDAVSDRPLPPAPGAGPLEDRSGGAKKWGNLPGSVIEEMLQSGRDGIPLKYAEILSRYYRRLGEIGSPSR